MFGLQILNFAILVFVGMIALAWCIAGFSLWLDKIQYTQPIMAIKSKKELRNEKICGAITIGTLLILGLIMVLTN